MKVPAGKSRRAGLLFYTLAPVPMLNILLGLASAAFVFGIAEFAKTYRSLPAYVPYSFGYRGEAQRWGSRPVVAVSLVAVLVAIGVIIVCEATRSPIDIRSVVTYTFSMMWVVCVQHFMFAAALTGSNRIPALQFWIVGIAMVAIAYAMRNLIT